MNKRDTRGSVAWQCPRVESNEQKGHAWKYCDAQRVESNEQKGHAWKYCVVVIAELEIPQ